MRFGRPSKEIPDDFGDMIKRWKKGELSVREIIRLCDISEATFYRRLREYRMLHGDKAK